MKKLHDMIGGRDKTLRGPRIIDTLNRNILLIFEHDLRYIIIPDSWFKYFSLPFVPSGNNETKKARRVNLLDDKRGDVCNCIAHYSKLKNKRNELVVNIGGNTFNIVKCNDRQQELLKNSDISSLTLDGFEEAAA